MRRTQAEVGRGFPLESRSRVCCRSMKVAREWKEQDKVQGKGACERSSSSEKDFSYQQVGTDKKGLRGGT